MMKAALQERLVLIMMILSVWGLIACSDASPVADSANTADMVAPVQTPALEDGPLASHDDAARAKAVPMPAKPGDKDTAVLKSSNWHAEAMRGIDTEQYRFAQSDSGLAATNMAHNFRARFGESGWAMEPRRNAATREALSKLDAKAVDFDEQRRKVMEEKQDPDWRFNLRFEGMGRANSPDGSGKNLLGFAAVKPALGACDGSERKGATEGCFKQLEFRREGLTEYFKNLDQGLEHGYVIDQRPSGSEALLVVESRFEGLQARAEKDGQSIVFHDDQADRFHYEKLLVTDAKGKPLSAHMAVKENRLRILVDDTDAIYPIVIDPLATTPAWMAEGNQADARFGWSVSSAGDINGDSYGDVIVGAPYYDNSEVDEGRAFVYMGSPLGLSTTADWTVESNQTNAQFGYSVASAGDVNGDGYGDVIVGSPNYSNGQTNEGRAFVYYGSATGLSDTAAWTSEGDQADALFGSSVALAGDVNADGYADVVIGAPFYSAGHLYEGRAFVYLGSATGLSILPAWTAESDQANSSFANRVASAGDVNGDGFDDVIIGAPGYDNGEADEGRVFVYSGSISGLSATTAWTAESNQAGARFGHFVAPIGDVNGDGYADVAIGAPWYDMLLSNGGRAYVYYGSVGGLSSTEAWTMDGDNANAYLGQSVASAGDVNGDGYGDVIVGAPRYRNGQIDEGAAFVYLGSASGLSSTTAWMAEGNQVAAYYGQSVASAGDVNGDGYEDVIIGAQRFDVTFADEGRAYLYLGVPSGLSTTPTWTAESDQAYSQFGQSVASAGM